MEVLTFFIFQAPLFEGGVVKPVGLQPQEACVGI
jgi:hypothetical protein